MAAAVERTGSRKLIERRLASTNYRLLKVLGEGTYGTVYLARDSLNKQLVAIKVIEKRRISPDDMVRVRREIQVLSVLRQPNIIQIFRVHEDDSSLYLVMEYADGGELYDFVERRKKLSSNEARAVFRQIVAAVHYCHKNGVVHRDLKLENILLNSRYEVKLTDFGLCNYFSPTGRLSTFCGSPLYASPEIISGQPYMGPEIDCWSLGVLLYALVYGSMPFGHAEFSKLRAQILSGQFFAPPDNGELSDAHELICNCLTVSAIHRATIDQISMHWWTNVGYIHYAHCDIYGTSTDPISPAMGGSHSAALSSLPLSTVQPMCSCFFDVLSSQFSKPPDSYKGKLATTTSSANSLLQQKKHSCQADASAKNGGDFVGVHARKGHGHRHRRQQTRKAAGDSQVPNSASSTNDNSNTNALNLPYPTPNSPATPNIGNTNAGSLRQAVSVDSLNGCGQNDDEGATAPWKFFSKPSSTQPNSFTPGNGRIVEPLRLVDADQPSVSESTSASSASPSVGRKQKRSSSAPGFLHGKTLPLLLPLLTHRRSSSAGRRPLLWKTVAEARPGETLLSSLLDPSVEHLDWCGNDKSADILHRQLSNYDNLGRSPSLSPGKSPDQRTAFLTGDMELPAPHDFVDGAFGIGNDLDGRQVPSSQNYATYSPSSSSSTSCSSGSLSCSCSCSSLYDGFVGTGAMPLQNVHPSDVIVNEEVLANMASVPPLQFLSSPRDVYPPNESNSDSNTDSNRSAGSKQLEEREDGGGTGGDNSARSAQGALFSVPTTLVDSLSSSHSSSASASDSTSASYSAALSQHSQSPLDDVDDMAVPLPRENGDH